MDAKLLWCLAAADKVHMSSTDSARRHDSLMLIDTCYLAAERSLAQWYNVAPYCMISPPGGTDPVDTSCWQRSDPVNVQ